MHKLQTHLTHLEVQCFTTPMSYGMSASSSGSSHTKFKTCWYITYIICNTQIWFYKLPEDGKDVPKHVVAVKERPYLQKCLYFVH